MSNKLRLKVGAWVFPRGVAKGNVPQWQCIGNKAYLVVATHRCNENKRNASGIPLEYSHEFYFHDDDGLLRYGSTESDTFEWEVISSPSPKKVLHVRKQMKMAKDFHDKHRKPKAIPCE